MTLVDLKFGNSICFYVATNNMNEFVPARKQVMKLGGKLETWEKERTSGDEIGV